MFSLHAAFGSRAQCLDHVHKPAKSGGPGICMMNLLAFCDDLDWEVVAEADELQAQQAAEALKRGE